MAHPQKKTAAILILVLIAVLAFAWGLPQFRAAQSRQESLNDPLLEEAASPSLSKYADYWLASGGFAVFEEGSIRTVSGRVAKDNKWRKAYLRANPLDTDNGYHPQNIFRLLTRRQWQNPEQRVYFYIERYNTSASPNRNESNGIFLISRYKSAEEFYFAGLQVDGSAAIKKRSGGLYYTLASVPVLSARTYNRETTPNLLPTETWMGLRTEVTDTEHGVNIKLYADLSGTGQWRLLAEASDSGTTFGLSIKGAGLAGIRSDFMDAKFTGHKVTELE